MSVAQISFSNKVIELKRSFRTFEALMSVAKTGYRLHATHLLYFDISYRNESVGMRAA